MNQPAIDYSRKWYVMAAVGMSLLLSTIDGTIVNIALPTLVRDFESPDDMPIDSSDRATDLEGEHSCTYTIDGNALDNEDKYAPHDANTSVCRVHPR